MSDDELPRQLCVIPKVFAFKAGHKASEWNKDHIWSGVLRVEAKGNKLSVILEHEDTANGIFATCPVTSDTDVVPVLDSSRYFVLRIENQGRHAFIGIGFNKREHAFDFKTSIQDHKNQDSSKAAEYLSSLPTEDFSLAPGQTITVNLKGKKKPKKKDASASSAGGSLALAPPPKKGATKSKDKHKKKDKSGAASGPTATADVLDLDLDFGGGSSGASATASASTSATAASGGDDGFDFPNDDDWVDF